MREPTGFPQPPWGGGGGECPATGLWTAPHSNTGPKEDQPSKGGGRCPSTLQKSHENQQIPYTQAPQPAGGGQAPMSPRITKTRTARMGRPAMSSVPIPTHICMGTGDSAPWTSVHMRRGSGERIQGRHPQRAVGSPVPPMTQGHSPPERSPSLPITAGGETPSVVAGRGGGPLFAAAKPPLVRPRHHGGGHAAVGVQQKCYVWGIHGVV